MCVGPLCVFVTVPPGSGAHEDIVVSSARAYISALNKMIGWLSVAVKVAPRSAKREDAGSVSAEVQMAGSA